MLIITPDSHLDHGLTAAHIAFLLDRYRDRTDTLLLDTVTLPDDLPDVPCALWGPVMGDPPMTGWNTFFTVRGARTWLSRMCQRPLRNVRQLTVIAGQRNVALCPVCARSTRLTRFCDTCQTAVSGDSLLDLVLFTAFGGPLAPREPGDPECINPQESEKFWSEHALSFDLLP